MADLSPLAHWRRHVSHSGVEDKDWVSERDCVREAGVAARRRPALPACSQSRASRAAASNYLRHDLGPRRDRDRDPRAPKMHHDTTTQGPVSIEDQPVDET
ncbi:unnamed protein product [Chrysodeixis includens]|uniref:Uncharacterized protein n=1 Tax=Chrysodeixis includens TaxID=689277 RepID=A0A9N8KS55_CHRIL|nr:unnamed protein product [Chrysodeixis includens]